MARAFTFGAFLHPVIDDEPGFLQTLEVHLLDRGPEQLEEVGHEALGQGQIPLHKDATGHADLIFVPGAQELLLEVLQGECQPLLCGQGGHQGSGLCCMHVHLGLRLFLFLWEWVGHTQQESGVPPGSVLGTDSNLGGVPECYRGPWESHWVSSVQGKSVTHYHILSYLPAPISLLFF